MFDVQCLIRAVILLFEDRLGARQSWRWRLICLLAAEAMNPRYVKQFIQAKVISGQSDASLPVPPFPHSPCSPIHSMRSSVANEISASTASDSGVLSTELTKLT